MMVSIIASGLTCYKRQHTTIQSFRVTLHDKCSILESSNNSKITRIMTIMIMIIRIRIRIRIIRIIRIVI